MGVRKERRKYHRAYLVEEIEYRISSIGVHRRMTNISLGGIFIDTPIPLPKQSVLWIRLQLPFNERPIIVSGEVIYSEKDFGMGVKFLNIKTEDQRKIKSLVDRLSKQSNAGR